MLDKWHAEDLGLSLTAAQREVCLMASCRNELLPQLKRHSTDSVGKVKANTVCVKVLTGKTV